MNNLYRHSKLLLQIQRESIHREVPSVPGFREGTIRWDLGAQCTMLLFKAIFKSGHFILFRAATEVLIIDPVAALLIRIVENS